mmetsp:Transcript_4645/g.9742  ORF Transcript_4645/g.9742 Transcript_4645/m.9742 type:complete len:81 (+) Transcript_4645:374-616(+)
MGCFWLEVGILLHLDGSICSRLGFGGGRNKNYAIESKGSNPPHSNLIIFKRTIWGKGTVNDRGAIPAAGLYRPLARSNIP